MTDETNVDAGTDGAAGGQGHDPLHGITYGPDAIVNAPLSRARKGYAVDEVDDLLDQLAAQTGDLMRRLNDSEADLRRLRDQLVEVSETESTLKRTLVTAQRAAEHSIDEARAQADLIRERSTERAQTLLARAADQAHELREAALRRARSDEAEARRRRRDLEEHIERLRTFADDHQARLRHHLDLQLERLASIELPEAPPVPIAADDPLLDDIGMTVDVEAELAAVAASVHDEPAIAVEPAIADELPSELQPGIDPVAVGDDWVHAVSSDASAADEHDATIALDAGTSASADEVDASPSELLDESLFDV